MSPETLLRANVHFIDGDPIIKSSEERSLETQPNPVDDAIESTFRGPSSPSRQSLVAGQSILDDKVEAITPSVPSIQGGLGQPLANDVGLISLANSSEPKYLGHSSGITFARLIFAAAPQSQGLSIQTTASRKMMPPSAPKSAEELIPLPDEDEVRYFVDAYFEVWHPLYPFLHEDLFQELVARVQSRGTQSHYTQPQTPSQSMDLAQVYLVVALGAKILESRLSTNFSADAYHATAMFHINHAPLHESIRGVQVLLLLVLSSLSFVEGLNAWFLNHTILASLLDLGLQRKYTIGRPRNSNPITAEESTTIQRTKEVRSGIFWSAYSLDRTLCVILGRPLTLRDEAIDIELPGQTDSTDDWSIIQDRIADGGPSRKRIRMSPSPYSAALYSVRFDRIIGEIKLMMYRLARSFNRFPWPTDLTAWQQQKSQACRDLLEDARQDIKHRGIAGGRAALQDRTMRAVELKFHQCMILLNRPSPAIPQPSSTALMACYESAVATIRIQSDLARFGNMLNSWLTAHAVFVSGITSLYCLWTSPEVRKNTDLETFLQQADSCSKLLTTLSKTWSVASNAQMKFEQLVQLTKESWGKSNTKIENNAATSPEQYRTTQNELNAQMEPNLEAYNAIDSLPLGFWDDVNTNYELPPTMLMDELGESVTWFDLDWLGDQSFPTGTDYYTF